MKEYLDLLKHIKDHGIDSDDRTGVGTKSCFGYLMRINLDNGFPLLTTKKVFLRGIIYELLWFLKGDTNIKYLVDNNVHIWDEWPFQQYLKIKQLDKKFPMYSEDWRLEKKKFIEKIKDSREFAEKWGELGPIYGKQWVRCPGYDGQLINQIQGAIEQIKNKPNSRRIIVGAWNVADIQELVSSTTAAPPLCHTLFQFYVRNGKLSCLLYQRSADVFLGVPFNIASYALLTMMMAQITGYKPGEFIHTFGDVHIYNNHINQVNEQLSREVRPLPTIHINPEIRDIFSFKYEDFDLKNYNPHPAIKAPIAV